MNGHLSPSALAEPCVVVIYGASGDLTQRKLIPALYELMHRGLLPERTAIVGVSRTPMTDEAFRAKLGESAAKFASKFDRAEWGKLASRIYYHAGDGSDPAAYASLTERIQELGRRHNCLRPSGMPNLLFYLSVAPQLYEPIISAIGTSGLVAEGLRWCSINPAATAWQRIIVEKPFGHDLKSAVSLNKALARVFEEDAIYRIDHYLGKELVQNILMLRFANSIFEPLWNRSYIDHIQLTAAESIGVGSRAANFYDQAGAMRDMVQSHLLQVLALVAMEPPSVYDAAGAMAERIKIFHAAHVMSTSEATERAVFGRYGEDTVKREPAYVNEQGVDPDRRTETFCAMRVDFDNWRWSGVPFYLRSGKKLAAKVTEVTIQFKRPPLNLFRHMDLGVDRLPANRLTIRIAPKEGLSLRVLGKVPGTGLHIDTTELDMDYLERFGGEVVEAYGPLILDAMRGDRLLYKHREEVEACWRVCQPLLDSTQLRERIETYAPGSWGPPGAEALMARDSRRWVTTEV